MKTSGKTKVVVIGLDGATWDLIKPWADAGELPAFKKLMADGIWGILESTIPPVTGPAWTSFATGKNPGKHGIFDFVRIENNSLQLYNSSDIKSETIYDILSKCDLRSVVIGMPLSFPPSSNFNGVMISDLLYPGKEIVPESKSTYLRNYRVFPNILLKGDALLEDIVDTANNQISVAKQLFMEEIWDLFFFYFSATDGVAHNFWKDISRNTKTGQRAKHLFYIADSFLEWIMEKMDNETTLLVMSDHGFADCPFQVNLNNLFLEKGLLTVTNKETFDDILIGHLISRYGIRKRTMLEYLVSLLQPSSYPKIRHVISNIMQAILRRAEVRQNVGIDFANSKVFVPTAESMSIYVKESNQRHQERIIEEIVKTLVQMEYVGQKVFKRVIRKEDVYSGPLLNSSPHILLIPNGFHVASKVSDRLYTEFCNGGWHDFNGVYLVYGSHIKKSAERQINRKIYDIAPTILHILGMPVPSDMDGLVLQDIFLPDSALAKRPVVYTDIDESGKFLKEEEEEQRITFSQEEEEEIKKRLKALGYLD